MQKSRVLVSTFLMACESQMLLRENLFVVAASVDFNLII